MLCSGLGKQGAPLEVSCRSQYRDGRVFFQEAAH